ncbi:MAG: FKBP-type peptidyl-prolyl cis-trans isomerase [Oscillospiraceae bacterium]|nr:FKBP-type peptidyl-prolyl cis-trans isomerase [Oscillospiraceae bacterium]
MKKTLTLTIAILLLLPSILLLTGCRNHRTLLDFNPADYINIADFRNIRFTNEEVEEGMQDLIERFLYQAGNYGDPERPLQEGDRIVFEFTGVIDFYQLEREIQYDDHLILSLRIIVDGIDGFHGDRLYDVFWQIEEDGEGVQFLDEIGFNQAILGRTPQIGQVYVLEITIPDNFFYEDIRGKDAMLEVTISHHFTGEFFAGGTGSAGSAQQMREPFIIGNGQLTPGFDEGLIGHLIREVSLVNVTFPEEYRSDDLAGKDVVFITVTQGVWLSAKEFTDEMAMHMWGRETVEILLSDMRDTVIIDMAFHYLLENSEFSSLPQCEVDRVTEDLMDDYASWKRRYGFESFGDMAAHLINPEWTTDDDFFNYHLTPQVEHAVKNTVVFYYMGRELRFIHSEAEIFRRIVEHGHQIPPDFEVDEDEIYHHMMLDLFDWIVENVIVE